MKLTAVALTAAWLTFGLVQTAHSAEPTLPGTFSKPLTPLISVKGQLGLADVGVAKDTGYQTIIDMRPDGEAADQPAASVMQSRVQSAGLSFAYVPTANGPIPEETVQALSKALSEAKGPVLLYCRSGSRSSRVWALAEASRAGGKTAAEIAATVRAAGYQIDDLLPDIERRIAARPS
jgi:uncharacterized protein (TIGR01244 family)